MIDEEFEIAQELWQSDEYAQDAYQLRQTLRVNARRARWRFLIDIVAVMLMAAVLVILIYMFWTPAVGVFGALALLLLITGLVYHWRHSQRGVFDEAGSAIDLLEVAIARSKKQISMLRISLFVLIPSLVVGNLLGKALVHGDPLQRIDMIVGSDESRWLMMGAVTCLVGVVLFLARAMKREKDRLKSYIELRETLIEEK